MLPVYKLPSETALSKNWHHPEFPDALRYWLVIAITISNFSGFGRNSVSWLEMSSEASHTRAWWVSLMQWIVLEIRHSILTYMRVQVVYILFFTIHLWELKVITPILFLEMRELEAKPGSFKASTQDLGQDYKSLRKKKIQQLFRKKKKELKERLTVCRGIVHLYSPNSFRSLLASVISILMSSAFIYVNWVFSFTGKLQSIYLIIGNSRKWKKKDITFVAWYVILLRSHRRIKLQDWKFFLSYFGKSLSSV